MKNLILSLFILVCFSVNVLGEAGIYCYASGGETICVKGPACNTGWCVIDPSTRNCVPDQTCDDAIVELPPNAAADLIRGLYRVINVSYNGSGWSSGVDQNGNIWLFRDGTGNNPLKVGSVETQNDVIVYADFDADSHNINIHFSYSEVAGQIRADLQFKQTSTYSINLDKYSTSFVTTNVNFQIYPNPFAQSVTTTISNANDSKDQIYQVMITDLAGNIVFQGSIANYNTLSIDASDFPKNQELICQTYNCDILIATETIVSQ